MKKKIEQKNIKKYVNDITKIFSIFLNKKKLDK